MKTGKDYLASLQDGRRVYMHGRRIEDVTSEPGLEEPAHEIARGYDRYFKPGSDAYHPMFEVPRSSDDLRSRIKMVFQADFTAFNSAACLALLGARDALRSRRSRVRGAHRPFRRPLPDPGPAGGRSDQ